MVALPLAWHEWHVKAKNERFTAASSRCRQNLKYENFTLSFGRLRQSIVAKSVPHVQHDYFSSFNQSNHWFVAFSLTLPSLNLKLPTAGCSRYRENLKFGNFTLLFVRLRQRIVLKCVRHVTCSTIIFTPSTNQIIVFWRGRCRCRRPCFREL